MPKEYWIIDYYGNPVRQIDHESLLDEYRKLTGNYFESKEEAEKAEVNE